MFAVKGGRFITHMKKLRDVEAALANFFASGVLALGPKLGPGAVAAAADARLRRRAGCATFFALLPRTTTAAAELATHHDDKLSDDRVWAKTDADRPLRHALEVRHDSFCTDEAVAAAAPSTTSRWWWPTPPGAGRCSSEVTSDFMYVRLHGDKELYVSGYSAEALDAWAARIRGWADQGLDVFAYFDNDVKVHAPYDAMALMDRLGLTVGLSPRGPGAHSRTKVSSRNV